MNQLYFIILNRKLQSYLKNCLKDLRRPFFSRKNIESKFNQNIRKRRNDKWLVIYFLRSIFEFDTKFLWKYIIHQSYLNVKPGIISIFFCFSSYFTPMISSTFGSISDLIWPIDGGLSTIRNSNGFSPISMALWIVTFICTRAELTWVSTQG